MELLTVSLISLKMLIVCLLFGILSWRRILSGIAVIALLLPSYLVRFTLAGIPVTALELFIFILFGIWLIQNKTWRHLHLAFWKKKDTTNAIPTAFRWPLILLILSAGISASLSPAQPEAFGILKAYFIEPLMLLIVMAYEVKTHDEFDEIMDALGALTLFLAAIASYQCITGHGIANAFWADPLYRRVTTIFGYPNASSLLIAPIVAYYIGSFTRQLSMPKQLYALLVITGGLIAILAAKTIGAVLAIACVAWIALFRVGRLRVILSIITILTIIAFLLLTPATKKFSALVTNISQNHLDLKSTSLEIRVNQWRETARLLRDHPFQGGGLANYQAALAPYHQYTFLEIYLYPHDIFLNAWTELGILGLIAFIWLLIVICNTLRTTLSAHLVSGRSRALAWGLASAWLVIVIHGLVDVPYFKNDLSALWMLFLAGTIYLANTVVALNARHTKSW